MKIEKEILEGKIAVVTPFEEIEVYNAADLKNELSDIIDKGSINIIIDLINIEYIDSSGLGVLVSTLKKLRTVDGNLILVSPKNPIKQILELTSLNKVFSITNDKEEAMNIIKKNQ